MRTENTVMQMILTVDPTMVGTLIQDLSGKVKNIEFNTLVLLDGRSDRKPRAKRGPYRKKIEAPRKSKQKKGYGEVQEKILAVASGLTTAEIIAKLGMAKQRVYSTMSTLKTGGKLKKLANDTWKVMA